MRLSPIEIEILRVELTIRYERNLEKIEKTDDLEFKEKLMEENRKITDLLLELNN